MAYEYSGATGGGGRFTFQVLDTYQYDGHDGYLTDCNLDFDYRGSSIYKIVFNCVANGVGAFPTNNGRVCFVIGNILGGDYGTNTATVELVTGEEAHDYLSEWPHLVGTYTMDQSEYDFSDAHGLPEGGLLVND